MDKLEKHCSRPHLLNKLMNINLSRVANIEFHFVAVTSL